MPPEKMNDDRLGRALDAFFTQRHSILANLALYVFREFDVPLNELHYDPTHLLFESEYELAQPREEVIDRSGKKEVIRSDGQLSPAHIAKGRATDDAPKGSLMVHVGLCTHVDECGPLPLFGHTVDGNQNGRTAINEQLGLLRKHLKPKQLTMISDRGTFSVGHLLRLKDEGGCSASCSAPWGEFRELFDKHRKTLTWERATYLSIEQQRRRNGTSLLPQEHYDLAVLPHTLQDDATRRKIACRVIFVFSTADQKVVRKQRQKQSNHGAESRATADVVFTKFKQQNYSEQVNRNLKGPLAVRPAFLHTPERVEALVFLLIAVLMLYYLLQRLYRQTVPEDAPAKDHRTTTRTILEAFSNYTLLITIAWDARFSRLALQLNNEKSCNNSDSRRPLRSSANASRVLPRNFDPTVSAHTV